MEWGRNTLERGQHAQRACGCRMRRTGGTRRLEQQGGPGQARLQGVWMGNPEEREGAGPASMSAHPPGAVWQAGAMGGAVQQLSS